MHSEIAQVNYAIIFNHATLCHSKLYLVRRKDLCKLIQTYNNSLATGLFIV